MWKRPWAIVLLFSAAAVVGCVVPCLVPVGELSERDGEVDQREVYRQERVREQILQHGAGGCTPNFSTGGCL